MKAVDTNVVLRLLLRDDLLQLEKAQRFIGKGAWVPTIAVAETIWVLESVYLRTHRQLADAIEMLLHHDLLVLQDDDAIGAALKLYRTRPSLGFSDCLMFELARKAGHLPLGTFDQALGKASGAERL